jgi:prepilin-type N-terminal cleavage/methylation domain-containing protein/prepilin-type processing-associated H-X9-DG protein
MQLNSFGANHGRRSRSSLSGFTLIELLVVIAIIALLAAILFPVFARARENARKASCMSNMKQLGLGFTQYIQDYDERYPGAGEYQKWGGLDQAPGAKLPDGVSSGHWVKGTNDSDGGASGKLAESTGTYDPTGNTADVEGGAIYPYVKNAQVYICPSNTDGRTKRLSYSMSCAVAGAHTAAITEAASVILLVDEDKANDGFWWAWGTTSSTDSLTQVHYGGGNLLFCDGHVKFYPFQSMPLDKNGGAFKTSQANAARFYDAGLGAGGYNIGAQAELGSCAAP